MSEVVVKSKRDPDGAEVRVVDFERVVTVGVAYTSSEYADMAGIDNGQRVAVLTAKAARKLGVALIEAAGRAD